MRLKVQEHLGVTYRKYDCMLYNTSIYYVKNGSQCNGYFVPES